MHSSVPQILPLVLFGASFFAMAAPPAAIPVVVAPAPEKCVAGMGQVGPEMRRSRVSPQQNQREADPRFEEVSREELVKWTQAWARNPELGGRSADDLPVFKRLIEMNLPAPQFQTLVKDSISSRLAVLEAKSKEGKTWDAARDFDAFQVISFGLSNATVHHTPEMTGFLVDTLQRVTALEKKGWGYQEMFPFKIVEALKINLDSIENLKPPKEVRDRIKGELRARETDLRAVKDELERLAQEKVDQDGGHRPYSMEIATLNYLLRASHAED